MTSLADYIASLSFLAPSLAVAAGIAFAGSITGTFVLLRGESLLALALPEIVAVGAAVGLRLGWPTLPPSIAAVVGALLILAWARHRGMERALLPAFYIGGLCITILLIANAGAQHLSELKDLITGMDIAVGPADAWLATPPLLVIGVMVAALSRRWLLLAQAPAIAELSGLRPARWNALFLGLLAAVVLIGSNESGIAMVLAMLFLPAATVLPWTRRLASTLVAAVGVALLMLLAGLVAAIEMNWPLSQSVGGAGVVLLAASQAAAAFRR